MAIPSTRIVCSLPCYGGQIYDLFLNSWTKMLQWANHYDVQLDLQIISNESLLPRARNMGVARLLDSKEYYTHILFLDADMGFSPTQLQRLLEADKPLVGCPGPTKFIHWEQVHKAVMSGKDPQTYALRYAVNLLDESTFTAENGFAKVRDFGCCFCLVRTEVLVQMAEAYPDLFAQHMMWINGAESQSANQCMFFDTHKDPEGRYLECDHAFMARYREIGGEIWADMTADLVHVGTYHFRGNMSEYFFQSPTPQAGFAAIGTPILAAYQESQCQTTTTSPSSGRPEITSQAALSKCPSSSNGDSENSDTNAPEEKTI